MRLHSTSRTRRIIAATWIVPVIVSTPYVYSKPMSITLRSTYGEISRQICRDTFDDIDMKLSEDLGTFRRVFFVFIFIVTFIIPALAVLVTCIKIATCLMRPAVSDSRRTGSVSSANHAEHRRKVCFSHISTQPRVLDEILEPCVVFTIFKILFRNISVLMYCLNV